MTSTITYRDIVASAGIVDKRIKTDGIVANPRSVATECIKTEGIVSIAIEVAKERPGANGRVGTCLAQPAGIIVRKRDIANSRVG